MVTPSLIYVGSFVALVMLVVAGFGVALRRANQGRAQRGLVVAQIAWMGLAAFLARIGLLGQFERTPPPIMLLLSATFGLTIWLAFSAQGRRLSQELPLSWLVGFQAFRIPVELLLHRGYVEGFVPVELTYLGRNFDVVTGVLGLVLGIGLTRRELPRAVLWGFNLLGLGLLLNVVTTAALAMPTRFQQVMSDPPNVWIAEVPFVWLPVVLVQAALLGHLLLLRRLYASRTS